MVYPDILGIIIDTSYSWVRMFIALGLSFVISLGIGISAARVPKFGRVIIPVVDILQTLPILAFFPFAIYIFVFYLPGYVGINAAVIFLIVTSMLWNMIFGVYQAINSMPNEYIEVAKVYKLNLFRRLTRLYIPAALPRMSEQMSLSWAIGLFYLVTSEIFSVGTKDFAVKHGIGVALTNAMATGNFYSYFYGIAIFIIFVFLTRLLLFERFDRFANRSSIETYKKSRNDRVSLSIKSGVSRITRRISLSKPRKEKIKREVPKILVYLGYAVLALAIALVIYAIADNITASELGQIPSYELYALVSLGASFLRIWGAFAVVLAIAVPLSIYVLFISKRRKPFIFSFQIAASIPATMLLPLIASLAQGNAEALAFLIYVLSGLWYVVFSILATAKYLPSNVDEIRRVFRLNGRSAWKKIYLKAIFPGLITGAITAIAAEWNASIVAEYFSAGTSGKVLTSVGTGIGKALNLALSSNNLFLMAILLVNMVIMILSINYFVWRRLYKKMETIYS